MAKDSLPSYGRPPVIETVLGVQFKQIMEWNIPHIGLFWQTIRDSFPRFEIHPPLKPEIESFDSPDLKSPQATIEISNIFPLRCWYLSDDDHEVLQVQGDRFLFNWRQGESDSEYPRYEESVRPAFEKHWSHFLKFLKSEGMEQPDILQCEVTYVNHIPKGEGWDTAGDWNHVAKPLVGDNAREFLPDPETGSFRFNYTMSEKKGRLRVSGSQAVRKQDGRQIIVLELTARGKPDSSSTSDILSWLDLGREWVVRGFTDITTEKMHQIWQRENS